MRELWRLIFLVLSREYRNMAYRVFMGIIFPYPLQRTSKLLFGYGTISSTHVPLSCCMYGDIRQAPLTAATLNPQSWTVRTHTHEIQKTNGVKCLYLHHPLEGALLRCSRVLKYY